MEKMKKLFKKPKWLRPEIDELTYWIHLVILASVVLGILQLWQGGEMFSIKLILQSVPLLATGDIIAHTILGFD
jgi:hypothetical protein